MLPEDPATTRSAPDQRRWVWRLENAAGDEMVVAQWAGLRFPSQADAESWVGEVWAELREDGVDAVTLLDGDRVVYGPMSLQA